LLLLALRKTKFKDIIFRFKEKSSQNSFINKQ